MHRSESGTTRFRSDLTPRYSFTSPRLRPSHSQCVYENSYYPEIINGQTKTTSRLRRRDGAAARGSTRSHDITRGRDGRVANYGTTPSRPLLAYEINLNNQVRPSLLCPTTVKEKCIRSQPANHRPSALLCTCDPCSPLHQKSAAAPDHPYTSYETKSHILCKAASCSHSSIQCAHTGLSKQNRVYAAFNCKPCCTKTLLT